MSVVAILVHHPAQLLLRWCGKRGFFSIALFPTFPLVVFHLACIQLMRLHPGNVQRKKILASHILSARHGGPQLIGWFSWLRKACLMIGKLTLYLTGEGHHETLHRFGERLGAFKILRVETHHWSAIISCLDPFYPVNISVNMTRIYPRSAQKCMIQVGRRSGRYNCYVTEKLKEKKILKIEYITRLFAFTFVILANWNGSTHAEQT